MKDKLKLKINNSEKGVSLIITFFILTIILAVVLSISIILYREIKIIRSIGNSVISFYAADSGIEKTLYYDRKEKPIGVKSGICAMCDSENPTCPSDYPTDQSVACICDYSTGSDCDPQSCESCDVSFYTNLNSDKDYYVTASVSTDGGISNLTINSTGDFKKTKRAIQVFSIKEEETSSSVVGRYVFYNNSFFDGNNPALNVADDSAIAIDKTPLLSGQTATFANYISYSKGINGIMIDILGANVSDLNIDDFTFKVGNDNNIAGWADAPSPIDMTVRPGQGVGGSDRITIVWSDSAIFKKWLQVVVLSNENTNLLNNDIFYFGSLPGDVITNIYDIGGGIYHFFILSLDAFAIFRNISGSVFVDIDNIYDVDRNGRVLGDDAAFSLSQQSSLSGLFQLGI